MDDFIKLMINSQQSKGGGQSKFQSHLGIITDSCEKNLYSDELQEIFNFDTMNEKGDEIGIKHLEDSLYIYPVKKKRHIQHHSRSNED